MHTIIANEKILAANGSDLIIRYAYLDSPFGCCFIASSQSGITHLAFPEKSQNEPMPFAVADWPKAAFVHDIKSIAILGEQIFKNPGQSTLFLKGTPFQISVWKKLLHVPTGLTASYSELATAIGKPSAARAVGNAVGQNRISYLIPCHRILRTDGRLGGYRWGPEVKARILISEKTLSQKLFSGLAK